MSEGERSVVILGDTRGLYHHGCEAVMRELSRGLEAAGLPVTATVPELGWRREEAACLEAELVVINGEGSLHHDRAVVDGVLQLAEERGERGRKTALVNSSWFRNAPRQAERLKAFAVVAARDSRSAGEMAAGGATVIWAPDLAVRQARRFSGERREDGEVVAGDSTRVVVTKRLRAMARRRKWAWLPVLMPPAEEKPGAKAAKVRRRCGIAQMLGPLGRVLVSERYRSHLDGTAAWEDYAGALSASSGVVTGRFHAVCFAIGLGVPFVAVGSNIPKIEDLVADVGLEEGRRIVTVEQLEAVEEIPRWSDAERAALERFWREAEERYEVLFETIARECRP